MLRPTKHSHPDRTVISAAILILGRIKTRRCESYDVLRKYFNDSIKGIDALFLPALNLLFMLGLIDYLPKTDAFEFTGPNETI